MKLSHLLHCLFGIVAYIATENNACAQTVIGSIYTLPANMVIQHVGWRDSVYLLRGFQPGNVIFANGTAGPVSKMNFDAYMLRLQAITNKGDTTTLKDFTGFSLITIGGRLFYNDPANGFVELIGKGPVLLAVKTEFKGIAETSSGQRFRWYDQRETTARFDRLYTKNELYFFLDPGKRLNPAVRSNLGKLFPRSATGVSAYADEQKIDFKRRRPLLKLLEYANTLEANTKEDTMFYKVRAGRSPFSTGWRDSIYQYSSFREGRITYSNGNAASVWDRMNFNQLTGNLDHISTNSDTVSEPTPENIRTATIDDHQFRRYPYPGLTEVISQGPLSLLAYRRLTLIKKEVVVDHPPAENVGSTDRRQYRFYRPTKRYYFVNHRNIPFEASRGAILKTYPTFAKEIEDFIFSHHTDFKKEKDLIELVQFVNGNGKSEK